MTFYIGCDLGGTNIKTGIVNLQTGSVLHSKTCPTLGHEGHDAVMQRMAELILSLIKDSKIPRADIQGLGISAPGKLNLETGRTIFLNNLPGQWKDIPLADTLSSAVDLPISLLNDVRAITYGEYSFGAGRGVNRMACFAIGTGLGGGLVLNGELVLGFQGSAGELGHQTIEMNGLRCSCGNYGCLETYTSGPAIASRAEKAVRQGFTTRIATLVNYDLNKITPKVVAQAAEEGDEIAQEIWESVGHYLGTGIANICVAFGPERVVLTGGVAAAGDLLLKPIKETLTKRVFIMPVEKVEVVLGSLGSDAGILGMASWAASRQSQSSKK
ncbi:MAG: ROK family protein [Anaerolineales bacterium]